MLSKSFEIHWLFDLADPLENGFPLLERLAFFLSESFFHYLVQRFFAFELQDKVFEVFFFRFKF
jgi:hypothetical protein